jgi:hypothetical protein
MEPTGDKMSQIYSKMGSISRSTPPKFGSGLKFESDPREIGSAFHGASVDIGGKDRFRSGTT